MKIEPMNITQIKHLVGIVAVERGHAMKDTREQWLYWSREMILPLILAWAHERARALCSEWARPDLFNQYFNDVLDEIGWPKHHRD